MVTPLALLTCASLRCRRLVEAAKAAAPSAVPTAAKTEELEAEAAGLGAPGAEVLRPRNWVSVCTPGTDTKAELLLLVLATAQLLAAKAARAKAEEEERNAVSKHECPRK